MKTDKHPSLLHAEAIKQICTPLEKLGIVYFSHVIIDEKNRFSGIATQPEFAKIYIEKKYYNFDIHQSKFSQQANYIFWDLMQRDPQQQELYDDFQNFSLGHSFTMIHTIDDCQNYYHFSTVLGNDSINQTYLEKLDFLKNFILYFNEKINKQPELKKAYDLKFILEEKEKDDDNLTLHLPIKRLYFTPNKYLTMRELECLRSLTSGKTADEIANQLCITTRTMKAHIANIKEKLNCTNLFQLGSAFQSLIGKMDNFQ